MLPRMIKAGAIPPLSKYWIIPFMQALSGGVSSKTGLKNAEKELLMNLFL